MSKPIRPPNPSTPTESGTRADVYTPSRLNREVRSLLETGIPALWLEGEISNLSRPSSGHWYFSLKDDRAQLKCAMFRTRNSLTGFAPKDGMHVLAKGRIGLYEPRGEYQFIADYLEEAGEGLLRRRFEELKARLAAAGLFAAERKRRPVRCPKRIGVITSPTGAALRDILHILRRRFPAAGVLIYPVPVQGEGAAAQIARAIGIAGQRAECEVLILARGGGSLEDLWAFNEEVVAWAIHDCPIPIVTGIGHEIDFTMADFVADVRAPTPSGAAELVVPDGAECSRHLGLLERRLLASCKRSLLARRERLRWLEGRLAQVHPRVQLAQQAQRLDELEQRSRRALQKHLLQVRARCAALMARVRQASPALALSHRRARLAPLQQRLESAWRRRIETARSRLAVAASMLDAVSPLATLDRGYAIVTDAAGRVIKDTERLAPGDRIQARVARGRIQAVVAAVDPSAPRDPEQLD